MKAMQKLLVASLALSLPLAAMAQVAPAADAPAPMQAAAPKPVDPPKISVTPYGIVSLAAYNNSGTFSVQDYPAYVVSEKEGATVFSARQSRVGVNAAVPMENLIGANLTGKIEFDFMGGVSAGKDAAGNALQVSTSFTSAVMRLRHAWVNADVPVGPGKIIFLMGQTDGLLNQLHPESTSYLANPLFQQAGNIHRRTGQIRLGYAYDDAAFGLKLEAAALNPTYGASDYPASTAAPDTTFNAGNRSGMPDIEARLGATMKPIAGIGGTVGVSILSGKRTYSATLGGTKENVTTSALGVDLEASLTEYLAVRGEYFNGKGIDDAYAGMATDSVAVVAPATARSAVESTGYWAQGIIKPVPFLWLLAGVGQEKPKADTYAVLAATSKQRLQNDMVHAGLMVHMNKAWRLGLEWEQTTTKSRAATATDFNAETKLTGSQLSLSTQLRF